MSRCPNCGTEFEGNFCPNCGKAIAQNICPKCKSPLAEGAKFCANCGHSLKKKEKPAWLTKLIAYCKTNWKKISIAATVLIAVILLIAIPASIASNIFRVGKVSKINIGDDQATVEELLGKPTDKTDGSWHYLDKKAKKIYQKMNGVGEEEESLEDLFDDLEEYDKLYTKLEKMTYSYIKVSFDGNGKVTEVFLDRKHHFDENDDYAGEKKYVKKVTTDPKEIEVNQIKVNGETKYGIATKISDVIYTVKYTDKSFYRKAMGYATTELSEDAKSCVLQWKDKLGEYRITLPTKVTEGDVILTNESGSFKVSSRGALLSYEGYSATLVIPEGITSISSDAFQDHSEIVNVTIPESVTKIESGAFANCTGIRNATLPASVLSSIPKNDLQTVTITGEQNIQNNAFENCSKLTSVTIGNGVTGIGQSAFHNCSALTSVTIPDSVTSIGDDAFSDCSALQYNTGENGLYLGNSENSYVALIKANDTSITSCTIHENTKVIYDGAFSGCSGLTSITIPDSVISIGREAFRGCSGLTSVTIPNSVTSIGDSAFYGCSGLASVTIPDSVTSIGGSAFYNCSKLTSITIGNGVTSIRSSAFYGCSSLTSVYYTGDVAGWCGIEFRDSDANPFYYAHNLYLNDTLQTELVIPDTVTTIKSCAFFGCSGLTSVTIPDSVTYIGDAAFCYSGLTSVTIGNGVTSIESSAFEGCSGLTSVTIPDSVTSIGGGAFSGCTGLTSVMIPDGVTSIESEAFDGCSSLTSVTIGNGVTSIGYEVFHGCSGLTSVTIGSGVTSIGERAFEGCSGLTSVTIPDSVTSIGFCAFYNCSKLTSVTIPDSVTSIGNYAFCGCSGLTSVTIGNGVTSIRSEAFRDCSGLTSVTFTGTKAQWNAISKGSSWNSNTGSYTVHCTDGDIAK